MFPGLPAPVADSERRAHIGRLRTACAAGRLTFDEFSERVGRVWAAQTAADLDRVTASDRSDGGGEHRDAEADDAAAGRDAAGRDDGDEGGRGTEPRSRPTVVSLLGDGRRLGRWRMARRTLIVNVLGNWTLDLRGALLDERALTEAVLDLRFVSLIGDLTLTVPDGVAVETTGLTVLGDRHVDLAPVRPHAGVPRVRLRLAGLIGDVRITSGSHVGRPGRHPRTTLAAVGSRPSGPLSAAPDGPATEPGTARSLRGGRSR